MQDESWGARIDELERWRERDVDPALTELRSHLTEISDEKRIAARVADELRRRGITTTPASQENVAERVASKIEERGIPRSPLTWYQRAGAVVAGAILLADAVRGLTGH